jgi:hypothetical protein
MVRWSSAHESDLLPGSHAGSVKNEKHSYEKRGAPNSITCDPKKGGFLLLGRRCLLPPHVLQCDGERCQIDSISIDLSQVRLPGNRMKNGGKAGQDPAKKLAQHLERGRSLVQFSDQSAILLDRANDTYFLLKAILAIHSGKQPADSDLAQLVFFKPAAAWEAWRRDFEPSDEFVNRAKEEIADIDEVEAANLKANQSARNQGRPMFFVLVAGMAVSVIAIGHLLSHHPARESVPVTPEAMRAFTQSLLLILILAGFDVAWTVLRAQSGDVIELNPLGSQMIRDPRLLIAFKCLATLVTVVILVALKRHRISRLAAWWACLVLALVAMRWLTITSIFT